MSHIVFEVLIFFLLLIANGVFEGSWLLDGMLSIEEFKEIFHLESLPGENRDG